MKETNNSNLFLNKPKFQISTSTSYNFDSFKTFNNSNVSLLTKLNSRNYEQLLKERCWKIFTNLILSNYKSKQGTNIKNFGKFTFINKTNDNLNDIPIFIVNESFIDKLMPGVYEDKKGLVQFSEEKYMINNNIEVVDVNYEQLRKDINISKEKFEKIIVDIIKDIKDKIIEQIFNAKKMEGLGIFLKRGNVFGMRFDTKTDIHFNGFKNKSNLLKKKMSLKKKVHNLNYIKSKYENNDGLFTKTDFNSDYLMESPFIKEKNLNIINNNATNLKLRNLSLLKLINLKLPKEILEELYNNKELLINKIQKEANNNNDALTKEDFIHYFLNINKLLDYETAIKIINIYVREQKSNEIKIENIIKLMNNLHYDIHKIINKNNIINSIRNTNNYSLDRIYNKKTNIKYNDSLENKKNDTKYEKLPNIKLTISTDNYNHHLREAQLYKLKNIISSYSHDNYTNLISYKDFLNLFKKNEINIDKKKVDMLFELNDINNDEQLIDLTDCILKINKKLKRIISKKLIDNLNKRYYDSEKDKLYITNFSNSLTGTDKQRKKFKSLTNNNNLILNQARNQLYFSHNHYSYDNNDVININDNEEIIIKLINALKERIYKDDKSQERITEYFDHLLSYYKNRKENILKLNEFEYVLKHENFNFSPQETILLFNYIDILHKRYIDRVQFVNSIKNIPFPLTIMHKYLKSNKLSVFDVAFKMQIDIYNTPYTIISNMNLNYITFFTRIKSVNVEFDKNFLISLYIVLSGNVKNNLPCKKLLEKFNVYNTSSYSYLSIYENREKINEFYTNAICSGISFIKLKEKLFQADISSIGKLSYDDFFKVINNSLNGKLKPQDFVHYLRINKLIELTGDIKYINFLRFIDSKYTDNSFYQCLAYLAEILDKECGRDIFFLRVKLNNINNNSSTNDIISPEKLYYIFKEKNEFLKYETMKKFDHDEDGLISVDDIKNSIIEHYDKHFFDNKKMLEENKKNEEKNNIYKKSLNIYIYIKELLRKNNLTETKFFLYLDKNKDDLVDKDEFFEQLFSMQYFDKEKYDKNEFEIFFNFLDEFKNNKINIDMFQSKLGFLRNKFEKENKDNNYFDKKADFILEDLILNEFCNWYKIKKDIYTEEEIFSLMDKDKDGIISNEDFKDFINDIFLISKNTLFETKITNLIHIISLNKENNNISLADFQKLIDNINKDDLNKYKEDILVSYIKGNNNIWIKYIIKELKMQINKKYGNDIEKMYKEYNLHFYQNKGQGLSFDNFELFISKNLGLFENYQLDKKELLILFNYISNNKKFINLNDLKFHFSYSNTSINTNNDINGTDNSLDSYNFYENMHKIIKHFLNENFIQCEDAFKFFQSSENGNKINDFITIKEFFNGINSLFPKKYETQTILNYFQKIFKKYNKVNELKVIKYNDFKDIYYKNTIGSINKLKKYYNTNASPQKIIHKINFLSYSVDKKNTISSRSLTIDPLEKMKRIIRHSQTNKIKGIIDNYINSTNNAPMNKYQFYNFLKKLNLGMSNLELEFIIDNQDLFNDGFIDLYKFNKIIFKKDYILDVNKKYVEEQLSEIKDLINKYYTSPLLAYELNIEDKTKNFINFDIFKKLIYQIYQKEKKQIPTFPVLKYLYDYIDYKKDGLITMDEWTQIFSNINGYLDTDNLNNSIPSSLAKYNGKIINLKEWENSKEIIKIFKIISKNRKLIKEKFKLFSVAHNCLLIHSNDLINIIRELLSGVDLDNNQWKLIVNVGKRNNQSDFVDFNTFISIIELASKII